ncbi:MAG: hypothetical protein GY750_07620 [Lentisphaerae bacterium]|nr:hypothetical protein [Lentisphaerota bacterium]MCP4101276.1 hypothetical protein [Lentisphaerota bacterium]
MMKAFKLLFSDQPAQLSLGKPEVERSGDFAKKYLKTLQSFPRNDSDVMLGNIDTNTLYAGVAGPLVTRRALMIQQDLIDNMSAQPDSPINKYRRTKYKKLPEMFLRNGESSEEFKKVPNMFLRMASPSDLTMIYPIGQALVDLGYMYLISPDSDERQFVLTPECHFESVQDMKGGIAVPELGIKRKFDSFWTKISPKDKLSSEY